MIIHKFNENNNEDYDDFVNKVKTLFLELWDDKIGISNFKIDTNVQYNLSFKIGYNSVTNKNFTEYNELFKILNNSGPEFQFISGTMYAKITNFSKLIEDMKLLLNSKKFNL